MYGPEIFYDEAIQIVFPEPYEKAVEELKAVKDGEDLEEIKAKTESLTQAFYKISEELYKAQAQQAGAEGTEHHDEDVVDADYEVVDDEENK